MKLQLKRATGILGFQRMASVAPIIIECIDYLAYGAILRVWCFRLLQRNRKFEFFDSRKKAQDVRWGEVL